MTLATAYWSLWIRVPAYIVGIVIFGGLALCGCRLLMEGETNRKNKRSKILAYALLGVCVLGAQAYIAAWDEKRVIAAFAEWFVAHALYYGVAIGSITAGCFIGYKVYEKTAMQWLGWVVGIMIGIAVGITIWGLCSKIPGVGWRMEKISEERKDADYGPH